MVTIGDESGAVNLSSHANAQNRYRFIPGETDERSDRDCPQMLDGFRMEQPFNRLIAGENRAEQNGENDDNSRQVFYPTVTVGETAGRVPPGLGKSNPQWNCRSSVGGIL